MSALDPDAMPGAITLEDARVAVLGYDREAREHALALRRANNSVTIGLLSNSPAWPHAAAEGFVVDHPAAAIARAEVVVVRAHDEAVWRQHEQGISPGALVVFASACVLQAGACARSGMDVVLVTGIDDERVGCRIAVHRDVTRRALVRAVAYARAAFAPGVIMRQTSIATESDLEVASLRERAANLLALAAAHEQLPSRPTPLPWDIDKEPEPADVDDASWFYSMLNRRGTR